MQIAVKSVDCMCVICTPENFKTTLPISRQSNSKSSARSRQPGKYKPRCLHGNQQHRLDHTYAAAIYFGETAQPDQPKSSSTKEIQQRKTLPSQNGHLTEEKQLSPVKTKDHQNGNSPNGMTNEDELSLKSTWLRNLCLEYQPAKKSSSKTRDDEVYLDADVGVLRGPENGSPKQCHKNRERKIKMEKSPTTEVKVDISTPDDLRRRTWDAALALIELSQSK